MTIAIDIPVVTNARYTDESRTKIEATWLGQTIQFLALPGLIHYEQLIASGQAIADPPGS